MSTTTTTQLTLNTTELPSELPSSKINGADTAWVLISTCLVFIMIPGLGYFYGGITRKKSLLTMLISTGLAVSIVSFQWFLWGFSLTFSQTGSTFIGNLDHVVLIDVGNDPHPIAPTIPANTFMVFQGMFACITPALAFGGAAERTPILTYCIFLFVWSTAVYDFVAYWCWASNGWLHKYGVLDYAGGTPVHITSGFSALAYALSVGPRRTVIFEKHRPSSPSDMFLGTALLWFGWFGFNGGSEFAINSRSTNAVVVTNIAAGFGSLTWVVIEMIRTRTTRMSLIGFCNGAVVGLVSITPSSGFVRPHYAIVIGIVSTVACYFGCELKKYTKYKYDDACDVFGIHGIGGVIGCLFTGIFADKDVSSMAGGTPIKGGWVNQNYIQLAYQLLSVVVAIVWSFVVTFLILQVISLIPCLHLRLTKEEEEIGSDLVELGETAYGHDIIENNTGILDDLSFARTSNYTRIKRFLTHKRSTNKRENVNKPFSEFAVGNGVNGSFNQANNIDTVTNI